jgi:hypothetical protein
MKDRMVPLSRMGVLLAIVLLLAGCAAPRMVVTDRPNETRAVAVGGSVEIRLPASMSEREWRLTVFDSAKLPIAHMPQLERNESTGEQEWVARFSARRPGRAYIEFTRMAVGQNSSGFIGQRMRFGFSIRD